MAEGWVFQIGSTSLEASEVLLKFTISKCVLVSKFLNLFRKLIILTTTISGVYKLLLKWGKFEEPRNEWISYTAQIWAWAVPGFSIGEGRLLKRCRRMANIWPYLHYNLD